MSNSHLNTLLQLNKDGHLRQGPAQRGFFARLDPHSPLRRLRGITKLIKACYPAKKLAPGTRLQRSIKLFSFKDGVVPIASNMRRGELVHRHIAHASFCLPKNGGCQCRRLYGEHSANTPALATEQISVRRCVSAAQRFLKDFHLRPVAAETKVCHRRLNYGTSIDAIGQQEDADVDVPNGQQVPVVPISWKTGIGPRDENELRQHQAQLAFEWATLVGTHGVAVEAGYIVYLTAARATRGPQRTVTGHYFALSLDASQVAALYGPIKTRMIGTASRRTKKKAAAAASSATPKPDAQRRAAAARAAVARARARRR